MASSSSRRSRGRSDDAFDAPSPPPSRGRARRHESLATGAASLAQALLGLAIVGSPWLLGAVDADWQFVLLVALLLAAWAWIVALRGEASEDVPQPWLWVPLWGALALGAAQLAPLPDGVLAWFSPTAQELRREFASLPADAAQAGSWQALTLYSAGTRRTLALLVMVVAGFGLTARFFRRTRPAVILLTALALNGAALTFFGLVQRFTWNGQLYWQIPLELGGQPFGPFVNRNHAGQALNLALAASLGLLTWVLARSSDPSRNRPVLYELDPLARRNETQRLWSNLRDAVGRLDASQLGAFTLVAFNAVGVAATLSRGAMLSMAVGLTVTAALVALRLRNFVAAGILAVAVLAAVGLAAGLDLSTDVEQRLATLPGVLEGDDTGRGGVWRAAWASAWEFPLVGSGLGTFRYVYPRHDPRRATAWYLHAENQYLEAAVDAGLVGLGLLVATLVGALWLAVRQLGPRTDPLARALGLAAAFALVTLGCHAAFDFGLYLPANFLGLGALVGLLAGRAALLGTGNLPGAAGTSRAAMPWPAATSLLALLTLVALLPWSLWETRRAAVAERALRAATRIDVVAMRSPATAASTLAALEAAARANWDDVELQQQLAVARIKLYQSTVFERLRSTQPPDADQEALWNLSGPIVLRAQIEEHLAADAPGLADQLRHEPTAVEQLGGAYRHLEAAERACPLIAWVDVNLAELGLVVRDGADAALEQERIDMAEKLAPGRADFWLRTGRLHFLAKRDAAAVRSWSRALELEPRRSSDIVQIAQTRLPMATIVDEVLPPRAQVLIDLALDQFGKPDQREARDRLLARAAALIDDDTTLDEPLRHWYKSRLLLAQGRTDAGIEALEQAVRLLPDQGYWRYTLALELEQAGRRDEARRHAATAARLLPLNDNVEQLVERLRSDPALP